MTVAFVNLRQTIRKPEETACHDGYLGPLHFMPIHNPASAEAPIAHPARPQEAAIRRASSLVDAHYMAAILIEV
jgi:hypothetical protein